MKKYLLITIITIITLIGYAVHAPSARTAEPSEETAIETTTNQGKNKKLWEVFIRHQQELDPIYTVVVGLRINPDGSLNSWKDIQKKLPPGYEEMTIDEMRQYYHYASKILKNIAQEGSMPNRTHLQARLEARRLSGDHPSYVSKPVKRIIELRVKEDGSLGLSWEEIAKIINKETSERLTADQVESLYENTLNKLRNLERTGALYASRTTPRRKIPPKTPFDVEFNTLQEPFTRAAEPSSDDIANYQKAFPQDKGLKVIELYYGLDGKGNRTWGEIARIMNASIGRIYEWYTHTLIAIDALKTKTVMSPAELSLKQELDALPIRFPSVYKYKDIPIDCEEENEVYKGFRFSRKFPGMFYHRYYCLPDKGGFFPDPETLPYILLAREGGLYVPTNVLTEQINKKTTLKRIAGGSYPMKLMKQQEQLPSPGVKAPKLLGYSVPPSSYPAIDEWRKRVSFSEEPQLTTSKVAPVQVTRINPGDEFKNISEGKTIFIEKSPRISKGTVGGVMGLIQMTAGFFFNLFEDREVSGYREYLTLEEKSRKEGFSRLTSDERKKLFDYAISYGVLAATLEGQEHFMDIQKKYDESEKIRIIKELKKHDAEIQEKIKRGGGYMTPEGVYREAQWGNSNIQ